MSGSILNSRDLSLCWVNHFLLRLLIEIKRLNVMGRRAETIRKRRIRKISLPEVTVDPRQALNGLPVMSGFSFTSMSICRPM
jgi:hypothetical protein